jgi:hypothetical protein
MKRINTVLVVVLLIAGVSAVYAAEEVENLFDNPGFED